MSTAIDIALAVALGVFLVADNGGITSVAWRREQRRKGAR